MLKLTIYLTVISFCYVPTIQCAKILVIVPTPSLSHNLFFRPIIVELTRKGHEVTAITGDPMKDPKHKNLIEIDVHKEVYSLIDTGALLLNEQLNQGKPSPTSVLKIWGRPLKETHDHILNSTKVQSALKPNFYDVVLLENNVNHIFYPLKLYLNCPMIGINSMDAMFNNNEAVGNIAFPSYYVDFLHHGGSDLTFWERFHNFVSLIELRWYFRYDWGPMMQEVATKYFGDIDIFEAEKTFDLLLLNGNPIFNPPRPLMPAMIHIGGLHYRERNPLPNNLKTFLDAHKEGIIYFSLGSNVKVKSLPKETLEAILEAFIQLPYQILLKWENDDLPNKPKNVFIAKWLPQQDVLDHPNVKAFVTQGGLQSVEEAISSKVPMLCIPIGADQLFNGRRIDSLKIGKYLSYADLTRDRLASDLKTIMENPIYKQKISKVSDLLWDQPQKPLDRAIWWIEYVIRHKGADHLHSPAVDMSWFKLLSLDVISFLFITIISVLLIFVIVIKFLVSLIFRKKKPNKVKKN